MQQYNVCMHFLLLARVLFSAQAAHTPHDNRVASNMCLPKKTNLSFLYGKYYKDVIVLRSNIKRWSFVTSVQQGIGDVEAEVMYMRLRELQPKNVVEFGFGQGLATMYILHALKDNGMGALHTFELVPRWDRVKQIKTDGVMWKLYPGDAMVEYPKTKLDPDYIHSDAEHSVDFAKWLMALLAVTPQCHVSMHDVFVNNSPYYKQSKSGRSPEGLVALQFLLRLANDGVDIEAFSVAKSRCTVLHARIQLMRASHGIESDWISRKPSSLNNPSLFFFIKQHV